MQTIKSRSQHLAVYYDSANRPHPIVEEFLALAKYRELILQFVSRSIKTRYKRSFLGVVWTLLNPLLSMAVLTIVFSQVFKFTIDYYPVYVLSGLVMWNFYSSTTSTAMSDMLWGGSLLGRIYVPKSVFAVSAIGTGLVNLLISLIPLGAIALILGVPLSPAILLMPLAILILCVFSLGVGLALSTAAVYFADMLPVYEVALTILMYATPIIYPIEIIPAQFQWLMRLNPLYYMVIIFRDPLLYRTVPSLSVWLIAGGCAILALLVGGYIFTSRSNEYAYRI